MRFHNVAGISDVSVLLESNRDRFLMYWLLNGPDAVICSVHHCGILEIGIGHLHAVRASNPQYLEYWSDEEAHLLPRWEVNVFLRADVIFDEASGSVGFVNVNQEYRLRHNPVVYGPSLQSLSLPFYPPSLPEILLQTLLDQSACCAPVIMTVHEGIHASRLVRGNLPFEPRSPA